MCAVGVPPRWVVDKLHAANILVMNMTGLPKHALSALDAGCDIICAQGTEAGGHTGDLATSVLIPATVDVCAGKESPLTGKPVLVVAAGGIYDGRGVSRTKTSFLSSRFFFFFFFSSPLCSWPCLWLWERRECGWELASCVRPRRARPRSTNKKFCQLTLTRPLERSSTRADH